MGYIFLHFTELQSRRNYSVSIDLWESQSQENYVFKAPGINEENRASWRRIISMVDRNWLCPQRWQGRSSRGEGRNKKCAQQSCREDPQCGRELTHVTRNRLNSLSSSRVLNHVAWAPSTVTQVSTCIPMTSSPRRPISPRSHFSRPPDEWSQEKERETKQTWLSLVQLGKYFMLRQKWHHLRKRSTSV